MAVLIRRFKLPTGMMQEERIDDDDRIERYMQFFDKEGIAKLQEGKKVFIDKDEWQLLRRLIFFPAFSLPALGCFPVELKHAMF